jgi:1-acyl-sn-glycerol-3-phosphate acyltransferase
VVPVAIMGSRAAMRKGSALIWPTTVTLAFLPPVPTAGATVDDRSQIAGAVRSAIQARLDRG